MLVELSFCKGLGERHEESVISKSSEFMGASRIWVDWKLTGHGENWALWVGVHAGDEDQGEKKDFWPAKFGTSSESESMGMMVGGGRDWDAR